MLKSNVTMTFFGYEVQDTGINLHFLCPDPGAGENSDWYVFLTDAEVASITSLATARTLVTTKLNRKFRAASIATKLDQLIGQSVVI